MRRVAVVFPDVRPLIQSMIARELGSTGTFETSRLHQFVAGKTRRGEKSSSNTTPTLGEPGAGGGGVVEDVSVAPVVASSMEQPRAVAAMMTARWRRIMEDGKSHEQ